MAAKVPFGGLPHRVVAAMTSIKTPDALPKDCLLCTKRVTRNATWDSVSAHTRIQIPSCAETIKEKGDGTSKDLLLP
ncbi:hypothetical protein, variant [Pyricularia oryzae 70-15]|nr:hypothetical protein, variant [Pyricularia oryzae 70-15]KAH8846023.1 hypothetical protein MCOR01_003236 [Pyricularia oryzae]EHA47519.1 hypothetical protein, variant [Pyricularia oryzae 70-15]KAI6264481.1 hypothetical protein MCOR34_011889 [Pyricularia oryzae]KAI6343874.1 hypothetical protein MCOR28_004555 [Pyricularia oryzae]KAI6372135.1 hypothetical protein MCOR31_003787 [Pyricularia oryzae]